MQYKYITKIYDNENCFDTLEEAMVYCVYIYNHYNRVNNFFANEMLGVLRNSNETIQKHFRRPFGLGDTYTFYHDSDYKILVIQDIKIDKTDIILHELYHEITDEINKYFIINKSTKKHNFHTVYYYGDEYFTYEIEMVNNWKTEMLRIGLSEKIVNGAFLNVRTFLGDIVPKDIANIICGFLVDLRDRSNYPDDENLDSVDYYPMFDFE